MRAALLLLTLFAGCLPGGGDPAFQTDKALACSEPYLPWAGGLTFAITQGEGDGTFDYDPLGLETRMFGSYDLATGDFSYNVDYPQEHWRNGTSVSGFGYAATNGDLDIGGTITTTDILGVTSDAEFRYERFGCNVTYQRMAESGDLYVETGTFQDGAYVYEQELEPADGSEGYVVEGTKRSDLTYTETTEIEDGAFSYFAESEGDGGGNETTDWEQSDSDADYEMVGTNEIFMDGSVHQVYDYADPDTEYTWDVEYDYEGNGGGTIEGSGFECEVTYEEYACTYDCGSGPYSC
jgi:hypothetical protein